MRTITITKTILKFDELEDAAKEKAVDNLRDININYEWWEFIYEDAGRVGLLITTFGIDRNKHALGSLTWDAIECAHKIKDEHGESCETYKLAEEFLRERDEIVDTAERDENGEFADERAIDGLLDDCEAEFLSALLECYASMLQNQYEYLISDEAIIENIEANGYEFTADGSMF